MTFGCFRISVQCVVRQWIQVRTSFPEISGNVHIFYVKASGRYLPQCCVWFNFRHTYPRQSTEPFENITFSTCRVLIVLAMEAFKSLNTQDKSERLTAQEGHLSSTWNCWRGRQDRPTAVGLPTALEEKWCGSSHQRDLSSARRM